MKEDTIMNKNTYRLMVKNESGRFQPVLGIDENRKPVFTTNVINGLCFWDHTEESIKGIASMIAERYPALVFELRKA
jgi:hypothetical protein